MNLWQTRKIFRSDMMDKNTISILGSQGHGMNVEMDLIRKYIQFKSGNKYEFRYFLRNELSKNPLANEGFKLGKIEFCQDATNVISVDTSLGKKLKGLSEEGIKLMLSVFYPYQYRNAMRTGKRRSKALKKYTHIIPGSPLAEKLLEDNYDLEGIQLIKGIPLPFSWEILQEEKIQETREKLEYYYPELNGKKIICLLVYGTIDNPKKHPLGGLDVEKIASQLGDNEILVTNSVRLFEEKDYFPEELKEKLCLVNRVLSTQELLYVADCLITNNGRMAGAFAYKRKPLYGISYVANSYEKYMQKEFPGMMIRDLETELGPALAQDNLSLDQKKFCDIMSYSDVKNPYPEIGKLFE